MEGSGEDVQSASLNVMNRLSIPNEGRGGISLSILY